jgi:hypothetical protein
MNKNVISTTIRRDEAEALLFVVKFHGTGNH